MKNPANNHNRSLYLLAQFSIGSLTFARESWRGGNGGEGTGRSRCMFTLSGVFAKSCFIDGGLEGSSRTLDGEEAEAKNQACVLHYKFSPSPRYTPVYYSLRSPYLPRRIGYNNNNRPFILSSSFNFSRKILPPLDEGEREILEQSGCNASRNG